MSFSKQQPLELMTPQLKSWFDSELGQELLSAEKELTDRVITTLFGVHLAQFSVDSRVCLFEESPVTHCFSIVPKLELGMGQNNIVANSTEVPLCHESVDVVLLHHALDFTDSPHQVLREASRILRPGGHVVIIGFNPLSYWGITRLFRRKKNLPPWCGHFISHHRLSDWLQLLELTELQHLSDYHRLPLEKGKWRARFSFMEAAARKVMGHNGAFSVVVARKDIAGMTPLRSGWGLRRLISIPVAEPSTRDALKEVK